VVELFITLLGRYARIFIEWYVRNTLLLSSIVVCYGLALVVAKRNLAIVEKRLKELLGASGAKEIAEHLGQKTLTAAELTSLRKGLILPIVTSPSHVFFRTVKNESLEKIFAARSRSENPGE
jgi:hypothetical protein